MISGRDGSQRTVPLSVSAGASACLIYCRESSVGIRDTSTQTRESATRLRRCTTDLISSTTVQAGSPTGDPQKGRGLVRQGEPLDPTGAFEFLAANQASFTMAMYCRTFGVSRSGYYG